MPHAALKAPQQEDCISPRNFTRLATFIQSETGIKMPHNKLTMLEGRLRRRVRATGVADLNTYCEFLFDAKFGRDENVHLINAVTTNKTDFFREPRHFDYLTQTILPELKAKASRRIRVWSAACSTGAEPYTLAMLLDDFADKHDGPDYGILATDLDTQVLEIARRGIYPAELVQPVPERLRARYVMQPLEKTSSDVRIVPSLRAAVGYARLNLMDDNYPVGEPMDIIFCRNVLIYFDKQTQEQVVSKLCGKLRVGGWLVLGHSESIAGMTLPVEQVCNTVFKRI